MRKLIAAGTVAALTFWATAAPVLAHTPDTP
jgi:hypothetical protein